MSYSWLPPVLAEIADIAGLDAAMALAEARGGQRVFIPASAGPDHWLVRTVGETAASLICEHYRGGTNGETIDVPAGPASSYRKQARKIRQMIDGAGRRPRSRRRQSRPQTGCWLERCSTAQCRPRLA